MSNLHYYGECRILSGFGGKPSGRAAHQKENNHEKQTFAEAGIGGIPLITPRFCEAVEISGGNFSGGGGREASKRSPQFLHAPVVAFHPVRLAVEIDSRDKAARKILDELFPFGQKAASLADDGIGH